MAFYVSTDELESYGIDGFASSDSTDCTFFDDMDDTCTMQATANVTSLQLYSENKTSYSYSEQSEIMGILESAFGIFLQNRVEHDWTLKDMQYEIETSINHTVTEIVKINNVRRETLYECFREAYTISEENTVFHGNPLYFPRAPSLLVITREFDKVGI